MMNNIKNVSEIKMDDIESSPDHTDVKLNSVRGSDNKSYYEKIHYLMEKKIKEKQGGEPP